MRDISELIIDLSPEALSELAMRFKESTKDEPQNQIIARSKETDTFPVSFAQRRLWLINQLDPDNGTYNMPFAVQLSSELSVSAIEQSLGEIIRRHEALRTVFRMVDGSLMQTILPASSFTLPVVDLREHSGERRALEAQRLSLLNARRPFDLGRGPLLRAALISLGEQGHILLVVMHHIVSDGWSMDIFLREIFELYAAFSTGAASLLAELPIQYADFAVWQREWFQGPVREAQLEYWRSRLDGGPLTLELPLDYPRPVIQSYNGATETLELNSILTDRLKELGRAEDVTLFMTLLAAFSTMLFRYTGQESINVGAPISNRTTDQIEGLIGFFVNTLVMRTDLSGEPGFRELLKRVREVALGAYAHQDMPFEKLVEELHPERSLSGSPLFQVMFVLQIASQGAAQAASRPGRLRLESTAVHTGTAKFDLTLSLGEVGDRIVGSMEYCTDLFEASTITRMLEHFEVLLESIVEDPDQQVSRLPMLREAERQQLLVEWNNTFRDYPRSSCIHHLFETQARMRPDSPAVTFKDQRLTYGQLNARANQLAHYLMGKGAGPESVVGICVERSVEMVVGLLAILKSGAAYLPLDPSYPSERLQYMIRDAGVRTVLTQQEVAAALAGSAAEVVNLDREWADIARLSEQAPLSGATADNLAYVIYTSGSTGQPKGVCIPHRAVVRLTQQPNYCELSDTEVFLQLATLSFDASTFEIWGSLLNGARLVVYPGEELSFEELGIVIRREGVSVLWLTTGLFHVMVEEGAERLEGVKQLLTGGDVLSAAHAQKALRVKGIGKVSNMYGPTENTTFTSCFEMREGEEVRQSVPIGRPISNTRVYVLGRRLEEVGVGISGELYAGGDGLARGYLKDPVLTAEKFIPDGLSGEPGARLYRTGDLVRYRRGGEIEFLGRKDQQVKIRGFRIELEEIEAVLMQHEGVKAAIVLAQEVEENDKRLVAYVVSDEEESVLVTSLSRLLKEKLPDYMMPSFFVRMEALPLTANGKVDRQALPKPDRRRHEFAAAFVAPRNQLERKVTDICVDVLGVDQIGVYDNFFHLGGHSLLITMIISRVREEFNVAIPVRRLFLEPTVAALSEMITSAIIEGRDQQRAPIERVPRDRGLPLSFAQQRLWFLQQLEPKSPFYNVPGVIRVSGQLDAPALEQAFSEVMRRHEVLRTVFAVVSAQPSQKIEPAQAMLLPIIDFSHLEAGEREAEVGRLIRQEARRVFDLSQGPMLRFKLVRPSRNENLVLFTLHHIAGDGWSINLLFREITALYKAFSTGAPSPLAELFIQYADYANWQRRWLEGEVLDAQLDFWKRRMAGAPPTLDLPTDHPRPAVLTFEGRTQTLELSKELIAELKRVSMGQGVTLFMTLLTAFHILLSRYTRQEDIVIGAPIAGRNLVEIEKLIGFFINMLVLRTDLSGDPTCRDLLSRVQETTLGAYEHQDLPFERLVEEVNPERSLSHTPLFQVVFALQNEPKEDATTADVKLGASWTANETSKFDLTLNLVEAGEKVTGAIHYNTHLFDDSTITRLSGHFETLLKDMTLGLDRRISELSLLTEAEERQLLVGWNEIAASNKDRCIHELIEDQVERTPQATAVSFEGTQLTYRELNKRANQLAHYLQSLGVKPETPVAICMDRSLDTIVALLGILKSGAAYLPLEPAHPPERLSFMIEDSRAAMLITQESLLSRLPEHLPFVCMDSDWDTIARSPDANPVSDVTPENVAYVIYTSGSTGKPKGVLVSHSNVARLFDATRRWFDFGEQDVWTWFHSYAFDVSVWEIWGSLTYGGRLVVVSYVNSRSPDLFYESLSDEKVTMLSQTPSAFYQLVAAQRFSMVDRSLNLRYVILAGEALDLERLKPWFDHRGDQSPRIINMYGITETTVHSTYRPIAQSDLLNSQQSVIGSRIADLQLYALDPSMRPVPIGVAGEIYVSGAGVARGYLNRPELTAERFVPNAFSDKPGQRLYKSGDLARFLADGDMEYLGRIDLQVKIRGFRIELGEIESALGGHPAVREAVVLANEEESGDRRLVAYVVTDDETAPSTEELRRFLRDKLPDYMTPAVFVMIDKLPLTVNGKLDRAALPAPGVDRPDLKQSFVPPHTELEILLSEMWAEILRIEKIGIHDDFFSLGGDSLKGAVFINKLQEKLGEVVHVIVIFNAPTIAELSAYLNEKYADSVSKLCGGAATTLSQTVRIDRPKVERILQLIEPLAPRQNGDAPAASKNPPAVFVLSPPRSGSTLFRVMLAGHPRLFAPPELELLSFNTLEEREQAFTGPNKFWLEGTLRALMEIRNCDAEQAKSLAAGFLEQRLTTQQFYQQMQEWLGDRVLVDKTPSYALDVEILKRAEEDFESPLYIHLLRHPLAMIRSFEEAKLDQIFFRYSHAFTTRELAALVWLVSHNNILEFLSGIPAHRQHQIKFEELVSRPEAILKSACEFLGLDLHPEMLQPYKEKQKRMTDGIYAQSRMLGDVKFHNYTGIDSSAAARWKEFRVDDDLGDAIWQVAHALGYEREQKEQGQAESTQQTLMPIERIERGESAGLSLSYAQLRLWFLDQLQPGSYFYNVPAAVRIEGPIVASVLEHSFAEIVRRHETLRTNFLSVDGQAVQVIGSAQSYAMAVVDLRALDAAEREEAVSKLATEEGRRPFDLAGGPMLRTTLLQLGEADHALLLTMHHIISDGWSMQVLIRETNKLYGAFAAGIPSPLPELPIQYADFAYWQRQWLQGEIMESQLDYWKGQLGGKVPVLELPTDRPRQAVQRYRGATSSTLMPERLSESLKRFAQQEGVTLFMATLAAFKVLLYRYSGQEDISVGTPIAGRNRAEIEELIGFFVNTLVMRTDLSGEPSFTELLRRTREVALGAFSHQDVPFERLVDELQPERSLSHSPLFQVMFSLQGGSLGSSVETEGMKMNQIVAQSNTAKFDLLLMVSPVDTGLTAMVEYNTDLFDGPTIDQMLKHLEVLLEGIVADPGRPISQLTMLTEAERRQLLVEWNDTFIDYPSSSCIHHLFQTQAGIRPDSPAVIFKDHLLTYGQLNARANQLAHYLIGKGAGPESVVGICVERSVEMVVGLLAVLKSGAAYLPLDPAYPPQRLQYMMSDAGVSIVLTQQSLAAALAENAVAVVSLDCEWAVIAGHSEREPSCRATADNLAYVIYTSGSTGKPKGTCITHRSVARLTQQPNYCEVSDTEVFLQLAPLSFDPSMFEIWASLLNGAKLVVYPGQELSFEELAGVIKQEGVSVLWLTAGLFHLMVEAGAERLKGVKQLLAGGDVVSAWHVKKALREMSDGKVINGYGPTESTTFTTCYTVSEPEQIGQTVPIGKPINSTRVYILDGRLEQVAVGIAGELYTGGDGLARGYLNDPALTAEKFMPDGLSGESGARVYRIGDLVRYRRDGAIEFLGRIDHQVKIRGFRIELEEIEAVLVQQEGVKAAVVLAHKVADNDKRLVAYIVSDQEESRLVNALRRLLKEKLPDYMMPSLFVMLDRLPLTANGKPDRKALLMLDAIESEAEDAYVGPRDILELRLAQIWEEVLSTHPVGVKENFFTLGGHSLLAVRLMSKLHNDLGVDLPLSTLFEAQTVEDLAMLLRQQSDSLSWSPVVAIQRQGSKPPFFCVHPAGGNVFCYLDLAYHLGPDQPFYGLQTPGLNGKMKTYARLEDLAACYIEALRSIQPQGPYLLGGWSLGGVVAFEMAQQLMKQGQQVDLLALLDSVAPGSSSRLTTDHDERLLLEFASDLGHVLGVELSLSYDDLRGLGPDEQLHYLLEQAIKSNALPQDTSLPQIRRLLQVFRANIHAALSYRPTVYPGRITLFRASDQPEPPQSDSAKDWRELSGAGLKIHNIPATHYTMIKEPFVQDIAAKLRLCFDSALMTSEIAFKAGP